MSLKEVARRFEDDEGNVFSLYERCWGIVSSFFNKLYKRMKEEQYKFVGIVPESDKDEDAYILYSDPEKNHPTIMGIYVIAMKHMIMYKKCDLDCLDDNTWEYLREKLTQENLIHR